jgi:hypothetical protein
MMNLMQHRARLRIEGELELRSQQFLLIVLFPQAAKLVRPSAFASPRRVVALVALRTLFLYGFRPWVMPRLHRWATKVQQERAATVDRLTRELGREPTDGEIYRGWRRSDASDRRPSASLPGVVR